MRKYSILILQLCIYIPFIPMLLWQSRLLWLFGAVAAVGVMAVLGIENVRWKIGIVSLYSFLILFVFQFIITAENSLIRYLMIGSVAEFEIILK